MTTENNAAPSAWQAIYQTCFIQDQWRDVDRAEYDRAKSLRADLARIVYAAPKAAEQAGQQPAAWIRMDHLRQAQQAPFLCRVEPTHRPGLDLAPIYLAAPLPRASDAVTHDDERSCALQDMAFAHGLQSGWQFGVLDDRAGYEKCLASRAGYVKVLRGTRPAAQATTPVPQQLTTDGGKREAFEQALRETYQMVDPLKPPPAGTYYRGQHEGIIAALKTIRENFDRSTTHIAHDRKLVGQEDKGKPSSFDMAYWNDNRARILDAIEKAGFSLMSNRNGFWLQSRATAPQATKQEKP